MGRTDYVIKVTTPADIDLVKLLFQTHPETFLNAYIYLNGNYHMVVTSYDEGFDAVLDFHKLSYSIDARFNRDWSSGRIDGASYDVTERGVIDRLSGKVTNDRDEFLKSIDIKWVIRVVLSYRGIGIPLELYEPAFSESDELLLRTIVRYRWFNIGKFDRMESWWEALLELCTCGHDPDQRLSKIAARIQAETNLRGQL